MCRSRIVGYQAALECRRFQAVWREVVVYREIDHAGLGNRAVVDLNFVSLPEGWLGRQRQQNRHRQ